jgi:hypothetical protein
MPAEAPVTIATLFGIDPPITTPSSTLSVSRHHRQEMRRVVRCWYVVPRQTLSQQRFFDLNVAPVAGTSTPATAASTAARG